MSPLKQIGLLLVIGGAIAGLFVGGVIDFEEETASEALAPRPPAEPAPVIVEAVRHASSAAIVEAVGTGRAVRAITLHPEAAGRVVEIMFEAGEQVAAGDPLVLLDDEDDRLAVDLAQVQLEEAQQNLIRYESVAPTGAVSTSEVDRARSTLSAARIQLAQAKLALRKRTLRAPFAGIIGIAAIEVGDWVTEATAIATLDDRTTLLVDFEVPEALMADVRLGGEVRATTWALSGAVFAGTAEALGTRIDPDTRTLRVRARLPNPDDLLRTGMSFTIRMPLHGERYPSVPSIAVQWDRSGAYVWRIADGRADRVEVGVLKREDQWILVDAPLVADDLIVVEGVQRLRPGHPVTVAGRGVAAAEPSDGR